MRISYPIKKCTKNIKLILDSANSYRAVIKMFNDNNFEYHTYQTHEEKSYMIIIRNLHHSILSDYIKESIESHGFLA